MTITVADALARLEESVESGELAALCERLGIEIVTLFGGALTSSDPGDVDVAVGFARGADRDLLGVVNALEELVPGDHLDLTDLDRAGPMAPKAAMLGARVLYEAHRSVSTEREIRAFMAYEDTRWLRGLQTDVARMSVDIDRVRAPRRHA